MAKAILIYGSTTGNTEVLSESVRKGLKAAGIDVSVKNVTDAGPRELPDYDGIILGCSTWGEGELQDDFIAFEEEMRKIKLNGKKAAVFGPGDSSYSLFCEAVDILERRLKECGARIIIDSLKIDGDVELHLKEAETWGEKAGQKLGERTY
jgi:flavodoxin I